MFTRSGSNTFLVAEGEPGMPVLAVSAPSSAASHTVMGLRADFHDAYRRRIARSVCFAADGDERRQLCANPFTHTVKLAGAADPAAFDIDGVRETYLWNVKLSRGGGACLGRVAVGGVAAEEQQVEIAELSGCHG